MGVQFGLFHGDPHPGNIFALSDGRIAYVDFGNVAEVSQQNKQTLIDAVVHAVNEDYEEMAKDFIKLVCSRSPAPKAVHAIFGRSVMRLRATRSESCPFRFWAQCREVESYTRWVRE